VLIGEFRHNVDPKGRLFMPAKFRDDLGENFIVTKGLDNCLFVYSIGEWKVLEGKIRALPLARSRDLQRFFFSGATEVEADKQGRILLPQNLRGYASLEKDAMIIGASNRVEIWNPDKWQSACEKLTSDMIADAMTELGF
jgi:MraZ protein